MTAPHAAAELAAGPAANDAQALDPMVLARLDELDPTGANGLVRRVLVAFAGSLDRLREQLLIGRDDADLAVVRYVAHTLKSSSGSVGATTLSQLCADTERRVREGVYAGPDGPAGLQVQVQGLLVEIDRTRAAVAQRLLA
jgi:HPt (histidine-containing phosphotransfer) domain-containing protein